ncbi:hypothetical protein M9978_10435 [Sphingomonas sp. MG17]|uniref:Uncharacterized protein n=1 Tax=Sphingomonas tagetis TaxID=2949092 RepID=A0A9X2HGR9_9SPHN|nr:hypothetical protein [Sphingomonas tagetis]
MRKAIAKEGEAAAKARAEAGWKRTEAQKAANKVSQFDALQASASADKRERLLKAKSASFTGPLVANLDRQQMKNWYFRSALRNEQSATDRAETQTEQKAQSSGPVDLKPSNP